MTCGRRRRRGKPSRQQQRGVALLVAILLVALGTIIAATMAYNNAMTARRAAATFEFDQALLAAQGAEALAAYGLQQQTQQSSQYIYPGQPWSQRLPPSEVAPGVTLEAHLEDLQGRFNINSLVKTDGDTPNQVAITVFQRLLTELGMDTKWAYLIVDWIDKNTNSSIPEGAEDSVYMGMDPPYRTANLPITSTSELMALPGFTRADFDKLAPHIVALPVTAQINPCSADGYVLDAITGTVEWSDNPGALEKQRESAGTCFPLPSEIQSEVGSGSGGLPTQPTFGGGRAGGAPPGAPPTAASLLNNGTSQWFRLTSYITLGSTQFSVYTVLYLDNQAVRPYMRSFTPD